MAISGTHRLERLARIGDEGAASRLLTLSRRRGYRRGQLIALLSCEGPPCWSALCALLDAWPIDDAGELEALLPHVYERLARWPQQRREIPLHWIREALGHPRLAIANTLDMRAMTLRFVLDTSAALAHATGVVDTLRSVPALRRLQHLSLPNLQLEDTLLERLIDAPWPALRHLNLSGNPLDNSSLRLLAHTHHLPAVAHLVATRNDFTGEGVKALSQTPGFPGLETLVLSYNEVGDIGAQALVQAPHVELKTLELTCSELSAPLEALGCGRATRRLRRLCLNENRLTDPCLSPLLNLKELRELELEGNAFSPTALSQLAPLLPRLELLAFSGNPIHDTVFEELAASGERLSQLRALRLNECAFTSQGARALASLIEEAPLERLGLYGNAIDTSGVAALLETRASSTLQSLELGRNLCDSAIASRFAAATHLTGLRELFINRCPLGDTGLARIARSPHLHRLERLYLRSAHIGDAGVIAFLDAAPWSQLRTLVLRGNHIDDAGALALARAPFLGQLQLLDLFANNMSSMARAALARAFRDAQPPGGEGRLYC